MLKDKKVNQHIAKRRQRLHEAFFYFDADHHGCDHHAHKHKRCNGKQQWNNEANEQAQSSEQLATAQNNALISETPSLVFQDHPLRKEGVDSVEYE